MSGYASVLKMLKKAGRSCRGAAQLLAVFGFDEMPLMPKGAYKIETHTVCARKDAKVKKPDNLFIIRLYFHAPDKAGMPGADLSMVANELINFSVLNGRDMCLDFVFTKNARLAGIIPIPLLYGDIEQSVRLIKSPAMISRLDKMNIAYYNSHELWIDLHRLRGITSRFSRLYVLAYIRRYKMEAKKLSNALGAYAESVYGENAEVLRPFGGRAAFVFEYKGRDGWGFKHFSLDDLEFLAKEAKLCGKRFKGARLFCALPGTYVPGKYIDIGFYDAIDGAEININERDTVLVIGFGAGIDIIHALRFAPNALGVEINPFGAASARLNLKTAGMSERAVLIWNDMRELTRDLVTIPEKYQGNITKVLWNAPYESLRETANPSSLRGFFDGYSFLDWFASFLSRSRLLAGDFKALLWRIADGGFELKFNSRGLDVSGDDDKNICIIQRFGD